MKRYLFIINACLKPCLVILLLTFFSSFNKARAQWVEQPSNITTGFDVQFIDAVDGNVCWGLVADPANQSNPVQEFTRTIDGGNTWVDGSIINAVGLCPSSICAINADTAWVAMFNPVPGAGKILRTNDGGLTWTHQTTALFNATGNFPDWVFFWDSDNGVCMGDPTNNYFEIYTTTDGGNNWIRTPDSSIAPKLATEYGITDVFTHQGDSTLFFGTTFGRVYKSSDRGLTWTVSQTPFTDYIGAIAFRDANNGLAASGGTIGSADVARTTDGGASWSLAGANTSGMTLKLSMCYVPGTDSTYFISTPAAGSVDGTTVSPNDGNTWVLIDNLIHTDIDFVNDSTGWTGSNQLNGPMYKWSTPIVFAADDVLSASIDMADKTGLVTQSPMATFRNNGLNTQIFNVTMTISGGYSSTKTVSSLAFNDAQQITFDPWTPAATGTYTVTVYTQLGADTNNGNDTLTMTVTVYEAFENYGWTSKPNVGTPGFGLAGSFWLNGSTASSPGQLFAIGGGNGAVLANNNSFATVANAWSAVMPMPTGKYQFSAQRVGNKIYCIGGYSGGLTPELNTYIYDVQSDSWNTGATMPVPVGDYASGVYNDSLIYYIGGFDGANDQNIVQIYNPAFNSWGVGTAKPGTATSGIRGGLNGNKIVIVGGFSQVLGNSIAAAYLGIIDPSDPTQIAWTALPPYPGGTASRLAAGVPYAGLKPLVIFAGGDPNGQGTSVKGDCWGFDLQLNQWRIGTQKTTAVSNISDLAGLVYDDSLWMASVGGYTGTAVTSVNEWLNLGASPPISIGVSENSITGSSISVSPNPVIISVKISFTLSKSEKVSLKIFDVTGRFVRIIAEGEMKAGEHFYNWNTNNGSNKTVEAGLYFLKFEAGNFSETKKLSVVR